MKQLVALITIWLMAVSAMAQDEPEYRLELGAGLGLTAYEGDFNNSLLKGMKPMGELVAKYKPNPRMAWALNIGYNQLKGSSKKANTWYPELIAKPVDFKTSLIDVVARFEYNFWPFGTGREYHGAKRLTPFISMGLGFAVARCTLTQGGTDSKTTSTAGQMPFGFGMKYKLADRLNLAAEWTMHFTGGDRLDGISDPYGIKSSGLFKNTDCYSTLAVTLTYDLWAKCKTCHYEYE